MKLHTVFITYNRLELTKRAIDSYMETVTGDWTCIVVDNGSTDGTAEWLTEFTVTPISLNENRYPGFACNIGWEYGLRFDPPRTHFHRADNDFIFLPGWCEEVERMFSENERLGQLGLRTDEEELFARTNVGGNCVIPKSIWKEGLRWDERPWPQLRDEVGAGWTEDSLMSKSVVEMGWLWDRVERPCVQPISSESPEDEYYQRTWADRGIVR